MNYTAVAQRILSKLENELSPSLHYHNFEHTLDVLQSVEQISAMEGINGNELVLIKTAALFHDAGYLWAYDDNELLACSFARKVLPDFDFDASQLDTICQLIMATQVPQHPKGKLAMILCDADLDYIGRDDFFPIAHKLFREWTENHERVIESREWYTRQFLFIRDHEYFTDSARSLRNNKKKQNLGKIEQLLSVFEHPGKFEAYAMKPSDKTPNTP